MIVLKCKKCGADLKPEEDNTLVECEYCGSIQTIPLADDEKKMKLFARANRLRFNNEFETAIGVYESIIADFPEEAEAYWGLILAKYGIEYVDDPLTKKKIPTCHRSSFNSILEDEDFEMVMEYADPLAKKCYRDEVKQLEELRKSIVEISSGEPPYDIFICYKEADNEGNRTEDSVLSQQIYDALTEKGYRVFFSRISLEDKLGQQYEPYIFAALNSAQIMLAVGTEYEYYQSVWVKNEWTRFLQLMRTDKKKVLIPCFKGIDAYDIPIEFKGLQAQDMGKLGFVQDLVRGIQKITSHEENVAIENSGERDCSALIRRIEILVEDEQFDRANELCEQVLNIEPENAEIYIYKFMLTQHAYEKEKIGNCGFQFIDSNYIKRAFQFGNEEIKSFLLDQKKMALKSATENAQDLRTMRKIIKYVDDMSAYTEIQEIKDNVLKKYNIMEKNIFDLAVEKYGEAKKISEFHHLAVKFREIEDYPGAEEYLNKCTAVSQEWRRELETIVLNESQYKTAKEVVAKVKQIDGIAKTCDHEGFIKALDKIVLIEKYYGNEKQEAVKEIAKYYKASSIDAPYIPKRIDVCKACSSSDITKCSNGKYMCNMCGYIFDL